MANELTGIERKLVLQYLMDANVPVTLTEEKESGTENQDFREEPEIRSVASGIFPVALPGKQMTVLDQGIILLQNPPESIKAFDGKKVRVQFYFNRLGLYFITDVKSVKSGLALVIPSCINKIEEKEKKHSPSLTALLYYSSNESGALKCSFLQDYELFVSPKWSDVPEEVQFKAKSYLEKFVMECRSDGKSIGNGLFLISVVRYLATPSQKTNLAIEGRKENPFVIYLDEQRIVFAGNVDDIIIQGGCDYSVVLGFPIFSGPIKERTIYSNFKADNVFFDEENKKYCAVCSFTNIKEEDARYIEDKKM